MEEVEKINPFSFVNSIMENGEDIMRNTNNDGLMEKEYNPFVTNRHLSQYIDLVLYANEMNIHNELPNRQQFQYLLHSIRKKKRGRMKWHKRVDIDNLSIVKEYYKYNTERAIEALSILTEKQIETIKEKLRKGGKDGSEY